MSSLAESIVCHINLDLTQDPRLRLGNKVDTLLILLALYRFRRLLDGDLRLRTACDLEPVDRDNIRATRPVAFCSLLQSWKRHFPRPSATGGEMMTQTTVTFEDELKKAKDADKENDQDESEETNGE